MNIYLHVEVAIRELDSKLLLAVLAASKGHQVILSSMGEIKNGIKTGVLSPGIFHTKSLTPSRAKIDTHQKLLDKGFVVTSIDEEGGFINDNLNEFAKTRFSEKSMHQVSAVFGWGKDIEILKDNYPKNSSKFYKTGSPRIDLNKPLLKDYWLKPKKMPNKPFLLVASNFSCTYHKPFCEYIRRIRTAGYFDRDPELFKLPFQRMSEEYLLLYAFIDAIKKLAHNNNDYDIVLRPHPREAPEPWKIYLEGVRNVHIIKEDAIMPWNKNAFALLHNSCSTAVEAAVAGTPVISYAPIKRQYLQKDFANKFGSYIENYEDLLENTNLLFKNNQSKDNNVKVDKSYETLSQRIFIDKDELSADKIIKVWESLDDKNLSKSNNWTKFYWLLKILNLKRVLSKIVTKLFPNKSKIINDNENEKLLPLDESDVCARVSRFQHILGIEKKLECKLLSNKTILIRPY